MKITKVILATLLTIASTQAQYSKYDTWNENYSVQGLLGAVQFENLKFDAPDSDTPQEIDLSLIPQLGGAWMTLPKGDDRLQFGLETTFLFGFVIDKINYLSAGGGGLYVNVSTSMWMFDFSGGGYANLFLGKDKNVRLYLGGGPLMTYADYRSDLDYDDSSTPNQTNHETAFGLGLYARTGVEFRVQRYGMLGLGARGSWATVDFTEVGGSSDLVGLALFASYTAGF